MNGATGRWAAAVVLLASLCGWAADRTEAQDRAVPPMSYYTAFGSFYDGDYLRTALRAFQSEGRGAIKTSQSRWIDSICYETMCGECYFQMGVLDKALQHYTAALQLYRTFPDWMLSVQFPPSIRMAGAGARKAVPWGQTTRQSKLGQYPSSMLIAQGQINMNETVQRGGVLSPANLSPISPQEIVRCTALAMRRRALLLGPASKYDPLTNDLITATTRPIGPPNHWSDSWVSLERGLALMAGGKDAQAVAYLERAVLAAGEFDHPMTSVALLELGRIALGRGDHQKASKFFEEATYAAVNYPDPGVLDEAFRGLLAAHLAGNRKGPFAPIEAAAQWAKVKNLRQLRASLLICAAENAVVLGQSRSAATAIDEARATVGRREMGAGWIGARLNYLAATVAFQQSRIADGNAALAAAMGYMQHGSLWLFHIGLADSMYSGGGLTPRAAMDLFAVVLRDPEPADWLADPMESLAVLVAPHPLPIEHWFEAAMERKDTAAKEVQTAIEIAERARRHRFFSSLDLGGRVESLRWVLEAAPEYLTQQAQLQRQDIMARHPTYDRLSQQSRAIRAALGREPLVADDAARAREQAKALVDLAALSARQEAILREIAVRREPAAMLFPPLRSVADVQQSLRPKHAVLGFFATSRRLYGILLNNERYAMWQIGGPSGLLKIEQAMLRDLGQFQANHEISIKDLGDERWRKSSQQMMDSLLKDSPADLSQKFEELVIVPDGALWYLPFEALQVKAGGKSESLVARVRIRYAPTVSLATRPGPGRSPTGNTAVVVGKLFPRDDEVIAQTAFEQFAAAVPGAVALKSPLPAPSSIYGVLFNRLVVFDDLAASDRDPFGWAPAPVDRGKAGSTLGDWFLLPWGGPDVVVLPGFHTAAEDSLKRYNRAAPGHEIFLSVCGLMANGARTVLLSRWRTGGQTSFDAVREFVQELPRKSPAESWQRAVLVTMDSHLNLDGEPRVKRTTSDDAPRASHPFFWAGYMLVDCGSGPAQAEENPAEPPADQKTPEAKPGDEKQPEAKPAEPPADEKQPEAKPAEPPADERQPEAKPAEPPLP